MTPVSGTTEAPKPISVLDAIKYARFIPNVIAIISSVQILMGPGNGEAKKLQARKLVADALALAEGISEKDLVNNEAFLAIADQLIELAVGMLQLQPKINEIAENVKALRPSPPA